MSYKRLFTHIITILFITMSLMAVIPQYQSYAFNEDVKFEHMEVFITKQDGSFLELKAEVASSSKQHIKGLSNRENLPDDAAMIFLFPTEKHISMWMKDTLIPLDIAFINKHGIITEIIPNATPKSDIIFTSSNPITAALETKSGYIKNNGINIGDKISWQEKPNKQQTHSKFSAKEH